MSKITDINNRLVSIEKELERARDMQEHYKYNFMVSNSYLGKEIELLEERRILGIKKESLIRENIKMREIKFRGWDSELKTMVYLNELTGYIGYNCNAVKAINTILNEDDYGFEYMQYTGLKDWNGKEIYEGDILSDEAYQNVKGEVYFEDGSFMVDLGNNRPLFEDMQDYKLEVIGNIYENPELI